MLLLQAQATGIFKITMAREVDILTPNSEVTRSIRIAIPVNPPDSSPAGLMNA